MNLRKLGLTIIGVALFTLSFANAVSASASTTEPVYRDIQGNWAQASIQRLLDRHIATGFSDGTFKPDQAVTRAQFVKMLLLTNNIQTQDNLSADFKDVKKKDWNFPYIETAVQEQIINTKEYGAFFHPEKNITRQEIAVMIARSLNLKEDKADLKFKDKQYITNHQGLIGAVEKSEIVKGYPNGNFAPTKDATRAQVAVILNRVINYQKKHSDQNNSKQKPSQQTAVKGSKDGSDVSGTGKSSTGDGGS